MRIKKSKVKEILAGQKVINIRKKDIPLYRASLETGLKLYGYSKDDKNIKHFAEFFGVDLSKYKSVSFGLSWFPYPIKKTKLSTRLKEDFENMGEEVVGLIGDWEYVFFPESSKGIEPKGKLFEIFDKKYRAKDGKIYTAEGEGGTIYIITVDTTKEKIKKWIDKNS